MGTWELRQGNQATDDEPQFPEKAERLAPLKGAGCGAQREGRAGAERRPAPTPPPLFGFGLARARIGGTG